MLTILTVMLSLSLQDAPQGTPLSSLVGKWMTTVKPAPGNAPHIDPSFTIAAKDGKVFVTFGVTPEALEATVFETGGPGANREVSLLLIRYPTRGPSTRMVMIRPIAADQVTYEMFVEAAAGPPPRNWSYAEIFKKSK